MSLANPTSLNQVETNGLSCVEIFKAGKTGSTWLQGKRWKNHGKNIAVCPAPSVLWQKLRIPLSGRGAVDGAGTTERRCKTRSITVLACTCNNATEQKMELIVPDHPSKKCVFCFVEFSRSFSLSWTCFLISTAPSRKHGLVASHQFLLLLCSTGGKSASYLCLRGHFLVTSNANRLATIF